MHTEDSITEFDEVDAEFRVANAEIEKINGQIRAGRRRGRARHRTRSVCAGRSWWRATSCRTT